MSRGRYRGASPSPRWVMVAAVAMVVWGCGIGSSSQIDDVQQRAYKDALERQIQGYSYEMRCRALLPLVEEHLWRKDYDEVDYRRGRTGLNTEWRDDDGDGRVRHEVHAHEVGLDSCSIQILRRREGVGANRRVRDVGLEIRVLESIDAGEARRIRSKARREAREVADE